MRRQRFAEPIAGISGLFIGWILLDMLAETLFGFLVFACQHMVIRDAVEFGRIAAGRQCGSLRFLLDHLFDRTADHIAVFIKLDRAERLFRLAGLHTVFGCHNIGGCLLNRRCRFFAHRLFIRWCCRSIGIFFRGLRTALFRLLELLEPELIVFLHFAHLLLHLQDLEGQFLDLAIHLTDGLFQRQHALAVGLSEDHRPLRGNIRLRHGNETVAFYFDTKVRNALVIAGGRCSLWCGKNERNEQTCCDQLCGDFGLHSHGHVLLSPGRPPRLPDWISIACGRKVRPKFVAQKKSGPEGPP